MQTFKIQSSQIIIFLILILVVLPSCNRIEPKKTVDTYQIIDSLKKEIIIKDKNYQRLKKMIPKVMINRIDNDSIVLYEPFEISIELTPNRPQQDSETFLSVPAAFTSRETTIEGLFFENGILINDSILTFQNGTCIVGTCIVKKDNIEIINTIEIDSAFIDLIETNRYSLFQQILLIYNSQIIDCNIWKNKKYLRRALLIKDNKYFIAESYYPASIKTFQRHLKNIGTLHAIYLDMGTWSEGWVKDCNGEIIRIGENMINTNKQTSWIAFKNLNEKSP